MNKSFRSMLYGCLSAIALAFCSVANAAPLEAIRYISSYGHLETFAHADAKFRAELAYQAGEKGDTVASANSDLRRDSHGFRQASADEYQGFAAEPSV